MNILPILGSIGGVAKFIGERILPPKKQSEAEKADTIVKMFSISESSTDSARQMAMTQMRTQKQAWLIRFLNGLVRPFGGLGALITEFYSMWGANVSKWFDVEYVPIILNTEQHLMLGTIIAFYFGSRLKEVLGGVSTRR